MILKKKSLYFIYDTASLPCNACYLGIIGLIAKAGSDIVQIRAKEMPENDLLPMSLTALQNLMKLNVPLIINDYVGVAKKLLNYANSMNAKAGAVGVHIGQEDGNFIQARKAMGDKGLLGITVNNLEQAIQAKECGADYIGYGAIFPTNTKGDAIIRNLDTAEEIRNSVDIPLYLIGGINSNNLEQLIKKDFTRICISSAIAKTSNPKEATIKILEIINHLSS